MGDLSTLKAAVQASIRTNGNQEITGQVLQNTLNAIINTLGTGAQYMGIATPSTNPGTPDAKVFYIASANGTYSNYGGITVSDEVVILVNTSGSWAKQTMGVATKGEINGVISQIGTLSYLQTTTKANLVAAINEVFTTFNNKIGNLSSLTTEEKTNLVAAINEVFKTLNTLGLDVSKLAQENTKRRFEDVRASVRTNSTNFNLLTGLNIKSGDCIDVVVKSSKPAERVIINYNGADTGNNRIFDGAITNEKILLDIIAPVDINTIGVYFVTTTSETTITLSVKEKSFLNNNLLYNILNDASVVKQRYIAADGNITYAGSSDHTVLKMFLDGGDYLISSNAPTYPVMCKYTDDTYGTPIGVVVLPNDAFNRITRKTLSEGYYALHYITGNNENNVFIVRVSDLEDKIFYSVSKNNMSLYNNIDYSKEGTLAIINGVINRSVIASYKGYSIDLTIGKYLLYVPSSSQSTSVLAKVDNSVSTIEKIIIPQVNKESFINVDIDTEGKYLLCYNSDNAKYKPMLINADIMSDTIIKLSAPNDLLTNVSLSSFRYINGSGVITAAGIANYKVAFFDVPKSGNYHVDITGNREGFTSIAKYSDAGRSNVEKIVLKGQPVGYNQEVYLESGYYAISFSDVYDTKLRLHIQEVNGNIDRLIKKVVKYTDPFNGYTIDDASIVGSATKNTDGTFNVSGGIANRCSIGMIMSHYYTLSAKAECVSGSSIIVGKGFGFYNSGDCIEITGNNLKRCKINHPSGNMSVIETLSLGFNVSNGKTYTIIFKKTPLTTDVEVIGENGEYFKTTFNVYNWYGDAFVSSNGSAKVYELNIGFSNYYDVKNLKLGIWGHSYIEATGHLRENYKKSFSGMLATELGEDKVVNFGFGGDEIGQLQRRMNNEVKLASTAQYGIICIGENDPSLTLEQFKSGFNAMSDILTSFGITPILFTLEPDATGYRNPNSEQVNAWIRTSGYKYVDMDKVFWNGSSIRTDLFGDGVHPTLEGHRLIYNRIKFDCPFLF